MYELTKKDILQLKERNISKKKAEQDINKLNSPAPYSDIIAPATPEKGIIRIGDDEKKELISLYKHAKSRGRFSKFVPASGAATRMFRDLMLALEGNLNKNAAHTMRELKSFPFFDDLNNIFLFRNLDIDTVMKKNEWNKIIEHILFENGLNYSDKPKALLKFTKYDGYAKTALEEHIAEGRSLFMSDAHNLNMHFTFSEKYISEAKELIENIKEMSPSSEYNITFSTQKPQTDTLALYENKTLVRDSSNKLLLRPGGHGALIENLNDYDADLVLIKNIDNIVNKTYRSESDEYNMLLCGYLLRIEEKIKFFTDNIDTFSYNIITQVNDFTREYFFTDIEEEIENMKLPEIKNYIYNFLNRPIRVCGMIENTGEPGGGPFFVKDRTGVSPQIVESSQIDMSDPEKKAIFESSTHFNPVNIVCTLRDRVGKKIDLNEFIDPESYFIADKTYNGKKIKALEQPGLWNGAMAKWLTSFVEVPISTFCPAKTVNDLLKKERFIKESNEV